MDFQSLEGHKIEKFVFAEKVVFSQKGVHNSKNKMFFGNHEAEFFYHPLIFRSCRPEEFFKKIFGKRIRPILRKTPVSESFLKKMQPYNLLLSQEETPAKVFPLNFGKFL